MMKSQLKKYNMMLTEKKQKYQQFNLENLINLVILQIKLQMLSSDQSTSFVYIFFCQTVEDEEKNNFTLYKF